MIAINMCFFSALSCSKKKSLCYTVIKYLRLFPTRRRGDKKFRATKHRTTAVPSIFGG